MPDTPPGHPGYARRTSPVGDSPVRAAFAAMREHSRRHAEEDFTDLCCVAAALGAAIPFLDAYKRGRAEGVASERERIRQLAIEHNTVADPCYDDQPFEKLIDELLSQIAVTRIAVDCEVVTYSAAEARRYAAAFERAAELHDAADGGEPA
jgi:hypothetical protein